MSDEESQTIRQQSIDHYGKQMQSTVCMEECGALIQSISKNTPTTSFLAEAMTDVTICPNPLKLMYGIKDKDIRDFVEAKTPRQAKRMEEAQ